MQIPLRIALRYIFSKRTFHFITVITTISIIGIVVGVAALISVMSIFNGFREFTENQLVGFDPHLRVTARQGLWLKDGDKLVAEIRKIPEVKAVTSMLKGRMIAINNTNMQVVELNAINTAELGNVSGIENTITMGKFDLGKHKEFNGIVIGSGLAERIKCLPKDTITLYSPKMIESSIRSFSQKAGVKAIVTGLFQTNAKEFDESNAYISISAGQQLFNPPPNSTLSIDIRLKDINDVDKIKKKLNAIIPEKAEVLSWYDLNKELLNIMKLESMATFIILSMIVVIAVFNILASLSMTVVEKKRDIGVLKSIGADSKMIQKIYMYLGLIIGLISTTIGTLLGVAFCLGQMHFHWFKLDTTKFLIGAIPISLRLWDVVIVAVFSLFLSFVAAIYPARRAAETQIIQSIREE